MGESFFFHGDLGLRCF